MPLRQTARAPPRPCRSVVRVGIANGRGAVSSQGRRRVRTLGFALAAALVALLAVAAVASAGGGNVVYVCGDNLCAIDGDGSHPRQLTTDGAGSADYSSP